MDTWAIVLKILEIVFVWIKWSVLKKAERALIEKELLDKYRKLEDIVKSEVGKIRDMIDKRGAGGFDNPDIPTSEQG